MIERSNARTTETERLDAPAPEARRFDDWLPVNPWPLLLALPVMVAGAVVLGWQLRGFWGPVVENRGWAALLVFAVMGAAWMVNQSNRQR